MAGHGSPLRCVKRPHDPHLLVSDGLNGRLPFVCTYDTIGGLLNDFSFSFAYSSLRHMLMACWDVKNGLRASNFLFVSVSRIPAMTRVVIRLSKHVAHKSAASAKFRRRM
ncbi:hypothetical protein OUZ56_011859 [Daphnia magna]|uniref:Uncharacterized protein n=1 Tax=Daphnia magna TaxID=35525 RepID=A0ABQ9Z2N0_9CRUS|nr:hypothetical protein OUZ56_011859 [Daphnia magna]